MSARLSLQRGDANDDDAQPVEQILTEAAIGNRLLQRHVRRRDDARRYLQRSGAPDGPHLAFFEHAQQPDLQRWRRVGDLVEEHRPLARLLEDALVIGHRARE